MTRRSSAIPPDTLAGLLLVAAAVLAMIAANGPLQDYYADLLRVRVEVRIGANGIDKPLLLWINDGLMALFFLLVALEIKRELLRGELSEPSRVVLPAACALGGLTVPAAIYFAFNHADPVAARGWAIPAATDIAFALGMLSLAGPRVPASIRTFLLTLAVLDDLAAILIIAAFYTDDVSWAMKAWGLGFLAVLVAMNRLGVRRLGPYLLVGMAMWVCVLKSGVHATLAGVVLGFTIPLRGSDDHPYGSPLEALEHALHPWTSFFILPVFAFANAGVHLPQLDAALFLDPVTLGVVVGLVVGKVAGVFGMGLLVIRLGWAKAPDGSRRSHLLGAALLAGIGFTMSLFIGSLAFDDVEGGYGMQTRVGVLLASLLASLLGVLFLRSLRADE